MISRVFMVLLTASLAGVGMTSFADDSVPAVSLLLSKASAELRGQDTLFRCEVVLDNATGRDLAVWSNFSSAFDGLEVVVTNPKGKVLAQQGYTFHQSPFAPPPREFPVKQGRTVRTLVFPVAGLSKAASSLKIRLVGTLPGSGYERILSSETLAIEVKESAP
jgi:hypothetical protein